MAAEHLHRPVPRRPPGLCGWRRSRSESPVGGGARVGSVGAIGTRADGTAEMLAELGMVLGDPGHRLADRAGHTGSSTLRGGRGSSITATQPKRARQLLDQEVAL